MTDTKHKSLDVVSTASAPAPGGHYSQGIAANGQVFVSGQLPILPDGTHDVEASFQAQSRRALENMLAVVEAGGGCRETIVRVTAYIVGTENWPAFNAVYADILGNVRPARTVVPVPALHYGYLVEVDAIALGKKEAVSG